MQLIKGDRIEEVKDPILIEAFKQSGYTELKAEKVEEPKEAEEEVKPKAKKGNKKGV
jgi:hypothetical protein